MRRRAMGSSSTINTRIGMVISCESCGRGFAAPPEGCLPRSGPPWRGPGMPLSRTGPASATAASVALFRRHQSCDPLFAADTGVTPRTRIRVASIARSALTCTSSGCARCPWPHRAPTTAGRRRGWSGDGLGAASLQRLPRERPARASRRGGCRGDAPRRSRSRGRVPPAASSERSAAVSSVRRNTSASRAMRRSARGTSTCTRRASRSSVPSTNCGRTCTHRAWNLDRAISDVSSAEVISRARYQAAKSRECDQARSPK